jgi:hypothetical protein
MLSMTSAKPHHTASQNMGCVIADINLDKTNIATFFKAFKRQKSLSALCCQKWGSAPNKFMLC